MSTWAVIPAFNAAETVGGVVRELRRIWLRPRDILVVDDGSTDATAEIARKAGAQVIRHSRNRGKGAALRTSLACALHRGARMAVALDADGQHPPQEALRLALHPSSPGTLLLGIRDLGAAGAPRANQISNGISNFFLSAFAGRPLLDTQCGLRRYPLPLSLGLGAQSNGFGFEAEIVLRAALAGLPIEQLPIEVVYPVGARSRSHFHVVRDPARIVFRVLATVVLAQRGKGTP